MVVGTSSIRRRAQILARYPSVTVADAPRQRRHPAAQARRRRGRRRGARRRGPRAARARPRRRRAAGRRRDAPRARARARSAVQCRADARDVRAALMPLDHRPSHMALAAERALTRALGGGCALPLGALAARQGRHRAAGRTGDRPARRSRDRRGGRSRRPVRRRHDGGRPAALGREPTRSWPRPARREPAASRASPLAGRTVVVTRPADRSRHLVDELEARGADGRRSRPRSRCGRSGAPRSPRRSATSPRAVRVGRPSPRRRPSRCSPTASTPPTDVRAKVAAIGDGTAAAFERYAGRPADLRPRSFTTRGPGTGVPPWHGPHPLPARRHRARGARGRAGRERLDAAAGRRLPDAPAHGARRRPRARRSPDGTVDAITFTSASTVRGFVGAVAGPHGQRRRSSASDRSPRRRRARTGSSCTPSPTPTRPRASSRRSSASSRLGAADRGSDPDLARAPAGRSPPITFAICSSS